MLVNNVLTMLFKTTFENDKACFLDNQICDFVMFLVITVLPTILQKSIPASNDEKYLSTAG